MDKKARPIYMLPAETPLRPKGADRLKAKGWKTLTRQMEEKKKLG